MNYVDMGRLKPEERLALFVQHAEVLRQLINSAGWKLYAEALQVDENAAFDAMKKARTGDDAMRAATAYTTIKIARELPYNQLVEYEKQIRTFDSKK